MACCRDSLTCVVLVECNVSFIVCVGLCDVFCLSVVCYFVWYVYLCVVSYCSKTATGQIPILIK
jgi:hypothetical protein